MSTTRRTSSFEAFGTAQAEETPVTRVARKGRMKDLVQRKGTHRAEVTLAKCAALLRSKKPDLEFSVDPLFAKTCTDFDEGDVHGLLMNHQSLGVEVDGGLYSMLVMRSPGMEMMRKRTRSTLSRPLI